MERRCILILTFVGFLDSPAIFQMPAAAAAIGFKHARGVELDAKTTSHDIQVRYDPQLLYNLLLVSSLEHPAQAPTKGTENIGIFV